MLNNINICEIVNYRATISHTGPYHHCQGWNPNRMECLYCKQETIVVGWNVTCPYVIPIQSVAGNGMRGEVVLQGKATGGMGSVMIMADTSSGIGTW